MLFSDEIEETTGASCALTDWSDWGECLPRCGNGTQTRSRKYVKSKAKKRCEVIHRLQRYLSIHFMLKCRFKGGTNYPELKQTRACRTSCSGDPGDIPSPDDRDEGQVKR